MSPGLDGDDDELVEIELELDSFPPPPDPRDVVQTDAAEVVESPEAEVGDVPDIIEVRQPIVEAADASDEADRALFEAEAAAPSEAHGATHRAALLVEVARLAEAGAGGDALDAARRAFAADPGMPAALWALRRQLAHTGHWDELATAYAVAAETRRNPVHAADLLVERGRLLEDRLQRDGDAIASYRHALAVAPDHVGALLALLLIGARRGEAALSATALSGLARRAGAGPRRSALAIEEARALRPGEDGAVRALEVLLSELRREEDALPVGTLLVELDALTRSDAPPEVAAHALDEMARRVASFDPGFGAALGRERARLLAGRLGVPEAAWGVLGEAARLDPQHPLIAVERLDLAATVGKADDADDVARRAIDDAASDDDAVDIALVHAELALAAGRDAAAAAALEAPRVRAQRALRRDLRAFELALAIRRGSAPAIAEAFAFEADLPASGDGGATATDDASRAAALTAAGAVQQWALGDAGGAEALYRRALSVAPGYGPALGALVALLETTNRPRDVAELLESARGVADEEWVRRRLVSIYAESLGEPARALPHQQRLVVLAPGDVARRVRLHDLELASGVRQAPWASAENLLALADLSGDAHVATALRVEAGRALASADDPAARARAQSLLRAALSEDRSGLAASCLERSLLGPDKRADVVAAELAAGEQTAHPEVLRALRFRLAHHHAATGRYAEALAALTPLRSDRDPIARAWSYELARRSGEAILEVAVLSEEIRSPDSVIGSEADVLLLHGEALARVGDPHGATQALRRCIALAPAAPTAADAALSLLRIAATDPKEGPALLPEALRAIAGAATEDPELATEATRESALMRMAAGGEIERGDLEGPAGPEASSRARAEAAVVRFVAGVRGRNPRALAEALLEMAEAAGDGGVIPAGVVPLLGRAAARARLAGGDAAAAIAERVWEAARPPGLAPALTDLPGAGRADTRRARARRVGGRMGVALDLEVALDAERRGALGAALAAYGSVIAVDPDRLEAWTGIRRIARAGGDVAGEARAIARLAALVRDPEAASALLVQAADAYEAAGRTDDAITSLAKLVELRPADAAAYARVYQLLRGNLDAPGRAETLDALLSHRLATARLSAGGRVALLYERAQHRLMRLGDRTGAFGDFMQILNIRPQHGDSIHHLAQGALDDRSPRTAAQWLERFLDVAPEDPRVADARLELAACYEAIRERAKAVETLKRAAVIRPGDPRPLQRLADLHLRLGDWRGAIEALRACEPRLHEASARAQLHLRIGGVLRDLGQDPPAAAIAFQRAVELDPLGDGTGALVALYDAAQDPRGALAMIEHEIATVRRALATDPLDQRRLERLGAYLAVARARGSTAPVQEAEQAVASVLELVRRRGQPAPGGPEADRRRSFAPEGGRAFWSELAHPAASGFVAELWPHLAEAAGALFPAPALRERRAQIPAGSNRALAWIEATAASLGLPDLQLYATRESAGVSAAELPAPALVLAPDADADPGFRFEVGRALGLLVQRATVLERTSAEDLAPLFACAAVVAGGAPPQGLTAAAEELVRAATRAIGRKDRKALALQASRFGFESLDVPSWYEGALRTAERLGLVISGDVALAAVRVAGAPDEAGAPERSSPGTPLGQVATSPAALDLIRFALSEAYANLRRMAG